MPAIRNSLFTKKKTKLKYMYIYIYIIIQNVTLSTVDWECNGERSAKESRYNTDQHKVVTHRERALTWDRVWAREAAPPRGSRLNED